MKKNLFYYLFAVICTIGLFTSCSDDDEKVVNPFHRQLLTVRMVCNLLITVRLCWVKK